MRATVTQNFEGTINGYILFDERTFLNIINIINWLEERYLHTLKMRKALDSFEFVELLHDTILDINTKNVSSNDLVTQLRNEIALCYQFKDRQFAQVVNLNDEFVDYLVAL